jgi:hypothetical protein
MLKVALMSQKQHNTTLLSAVAISVAVLFASFFAMSFVHQVLAQSKPSNSTAAAAGGNATASGNPSNGAATKGSGPTTTVPSTSNSAPGY